MVALLHGKENKYINMSKTKNMANKTLDTVIMKLSQMYCSLWFWGRCTLRNKNDFDYFISNLQQDYDTPVNLGAFFQKKITLNDDSEKSSAVKIGNIQIEYSFTKNKENTLIHLFGYNAMEEVVKALLYMTKKAHHNASVFSLSKHRKEKADGTKYRKSNS